MSDFFQHVRGGFTLYLGGDDVSIPDVRFLLLHHGEDVALATKALFAERRGDFLVVPVTAYGAVPRRELSTQASLVEALRTLTVEPGSIIEQRWKKLCEQMHVAWPKRLQAA